MRRKEDRGDVELLGAYVDGVAELSLDERKRVDDLLARDPALRDDEAATRALIGELRDLPPPGGEPDWKALERSIGDAVGQDVPRPWWVKLRWRVIVPGVALAMTAAILALVLHDPGVEPASDRPAPAVAPVAKDDAVAPVDDEAAIAASTPLWLDGTDLDVALEAAELFDLDWDLDDEALPATAELLPSPGLDSLEWVDDLDPESLERAEHFLDQRPRRGRT